MTTELFDDTNLATATLLAEDLRAWVAEETLANLAMSVAHSIDESRFKRVTAPFESAPVASRPALAMLTYCYARGLFSSLDIEGLCAADETLGYLSGGGKPDVDFLRRFRRKHRDVIEHCLEIVCLVVWRIRHGTWQTPQPWTGSRTLVTTERINPLFRMQIICEVMERLNRAENEDRCEYTAEAVGG